MKNGALLVFCFFLWGAVGRAEPLISAEMPSERVRDEGQFVTTSARSLLADYLDTLSVTQKTEFYVVILKDIAIAEAAKLCDRWQQEWVPKGQGGVFVYSVPDKKYAFTPSPETLRTVGTEKTQALFISAVENPPLRQSLDVVISTPVFRMVTAINQARLEEDGRRAEVGESQTTRWQVIAGMAGAFALLGWILCFTKLAKGLDTKAFRSNIPPPGMAYRNPPRKSRRGRTHVDDRQEGVREPRKKDRF